MKKYFKDIVSGITHLIGAIMSIVGLVLIIVRSITVGEGAWDIVATVIFTLTLIFLYLFSALYHLCKVSKKTERVLRKFDHIMIYFLIAGSYTPLCLGAIRGVWGWSIFGFIWILAILGAILTVLWLEAPRWLTTTIYMIMGWVVVIASYPMWIYYRDNNALSMFWWLLAGGIFYTVGGIMYAIKKPNISKLWGFHEIFHIFIMLR